MRFDRKSRNQRTKGIGSPLDDAADFFSPSTVEGFCEVKESHKAALWLGGLEAITDGLRDSNDLVLAEAKLAEAILLSRLGCITGCAPFSPALAYRPFDTL